MLVVLDIFYGVKEVNEQSSYLTGNIHLGSYFFNTLQIALQL